MKKENKSKTLGFEKTIRLGRDLLFCPKNSRELNAKKKLSR
jgi:hypothetical protein